MIKAVETALSEIGTKQEQKHSIKYYDEILPDDKFKPWCVPFIEWVFEKSYGKEEALKKLCLTEYTQSVATLAGAFRDHGMWHREFVSEGWIIFLRQEEHKQINHVELITSITDDELSTVGGNCDKEVKANTFKISDKRIAGYGQIGYDENGDSELVRVRDWAYL